MDGSVMNVKRIDACVRHGWVPREGLMDYTSRRCQEYLSQPQRLAGAGVKAPPIQVLARLESVGAGA
jgi:hypothetical protein